MNEQLGDRLPLPVNKKRLEEGIVDVDRKKEKKSTE